MLRAPRQLQHSSIAVQLRDTHRVASITRNAGQRRWTQRRRLPAAGARRARAAALRVPRVRLRRRGHAAGEPRGLWPLRAAAARCGRSTRSTACELFGNELALPVFASPAGVHSLVDGEGERATARACGRAGVLFGLSQHATVCIEDVAAAAPGAHRWFQNALLKDRAATLDLVRRAVAAGYRGVFLTVDSVRFGFREVDARNNFCALPPLTLANYVATPPAGAAAWEAREHRAWDQNSEALFDTAASWDAVSWLRGARPRIRRYP